MQQGLFHACTAGLIIMLVVMRAIFAWLHAWGVLAIWRSPDSPAQYETPTLQHNLLQSLNWFITKQRQDIDGSIADAFYIETGAKMKQSKVGNWPWSGTARGLCLNVRPAFPWLALPFKGGGLAGSWG